MSSATVTGDRGLRSAVDEAGPGELWWRKRDGGLIVDVIGDWTFDHVSAIDRRLDELVAEAKRIGSGHADVRLDSITSLDMSGAWLLHRLEVELALPGWTVDMPVEDPRHVALLDALREIAFDAPQEPSAGSGFPRMLDRLGRGTIDAGLEGCRLLSFFGRTVSTLLRSLLRPRRLRLTSLTHHLEQTCLNALPIVGLIAFLIGVVMAYQGADQLKRFGAEIFTVDLLGVSILREIGILLTAIVVAGRSGSAFTAEIGAMAVNQEIDALRTLGLDEVEVLVLPRMLALMIALPLLAFFADILGLFGGGLMAWIVLDIAPGPFLNQLEGAIEPATFWVGIVKAPVFAFLIALVGCYQGLLVSGGADSVGRHTTKSVVIGIFLVIVFDALFSILFSLLGV